jgi:hypothetical protein
MTQDAAFAVKRQSDRAACRDRQADRVAFRAGDPAQTKFRFRRNERKVAQAGPQATEIIGLEIKHLRQI